MTPGNAVPLEISNDYLEAQAQAVVNQSNSVTRNLAEAVFPRMREKRVEKVAAEYTELITALSARYPVVAEHITEESAHNPDEIKPFYPKDDEGFLQGIGLVFSDQKSATKGVLALGRQLGSESSLSPRDKISAIREATVHAEDAFSLAVLVESALRKINSGELSEPNHIRNILARAANYSKSFYDAYHNSSSYSPLSHAQEIASFIKDMRNPNDDQTFKAYEKLMDDKERAIKQHRKNARTNEKAAEAATLRQASLVNDPTAANDAVLDWEDYSSKAEEATDSADRLQATNDVLEKLLSGSLVEACQAILELPNVL